MQRIKASLKEYSVLLTTMHAAQTIFSRSNSFFRNADYLNWHRLQSKQHILRSQLGFTTQSPSRPKCCQGCMNYHGLAYGHNRTALICGFHPYGWQSGDSCPDWCGAT